MGGQSTGVYLDRKRHTAIAVKNLDRTKPLDWGFPGGIVENGETSQIAMMREGEEEVGNADFIISPDTQPMIVLPRTGRHGDYVQNIFLIPDSGEELRKTGVPNEVGPPTRILLKDITTGKIKFFWSHLEVLRLVLEKLSEEDIELDDRLSELKKLLGIPQ